MNLRKELEELEEGRRRTRRRRKKEEGRRKKEEGKRKKEEGRWKRENVPGGATLGGCRLARASDRPQK